MSNILTAYLYKYSSQKITKLKQKNKALKNKADSKDVPVESSPTIFIESSWVKYSQGDKNTFFRTVFAHTKYNDTGCLNEFLITSESKMKRYLNLHDVLERLNDDDLHIEGVTL